MKREKEYFTKIPNRYVRCDINTKFELSRKFYITYILINKYRSYENYSWITLNKILEFYSYNTSKKTSKIFSEVLLILEYMKNNGMIKLFQDLTSISRDTGIEIKIMSEKFDVINDFSILTSTQYNSISTANTSIGKENLLVTFLYINSYIGYRLKDDEFTSCAFFGSINNMANKLSMSKNTINKCLDFFVKGDKNNPPLLVKETSKNKMPNIYVLNQDGYEKELLLAKQQFSQK